MLPILLLLFSRLNHNTFKLLLVTNFVMMCFVTHLKLSAHLSQSIFLSYFFSSGPFFSFFFIKMCKNYCFDILFAKVLFHISIFVDTQLLIPFQVMDSVVRLVKTYIELCRSGCLLFLKWAAKFFFDTARGVCCIVEFFQGEETVTKLKGRQESHSLEQYMAKVTM